MLKFGIRHFVAVTAIVAVAAYIVVFSRLGYAPIHSDGYSYYVYLPSSAIYHDLTFEALARDWEGRIGVGTGGFPGANFQFRLGRDSLALHPGGERNALADQIIGVAVHERVAAGSS